MKLRRLKTRMHYPLKRSSAPLLTGFLRSLEAGILSLRLRPAADALYLATARGRWLGEWAGLYAYRAKAIETENALRTRIQQDTILERMKTTKPAIEAALLEATGLTCLLRLSRTRVYRFDDLGRAFNRGGLNTPEHGLDYFSVGEGGAVYWDQLPPAHPASRALMPQGDAYGPGGVLIHVPAPYSAALEEAVELALRDHLATFSGYTLSWQATLYIEMSEAVLADEHTTPNASGWDTDPWSTAPWG